MTEDQKIKLADHTNVGKCYTAYEKNDPARKRHRIGIIEDEVSELEDEYRFVIQKIKLDEPTPSGGTHVWRIGYYVWTADWRCILFGQFAPAMNTPTLFGLLEKARVKWGVFTVR